MGVRVVGGTGVGGFLEYGRGWFGVGWGQVGLGELADLRVDGVHDLGVRDVFLGGERDLGRK